MTAKKHLALFGALSLVIGFWTPAIASAPAEAFSPGSTGVFTPFKGASTFPTGTPVTTEAELKSALEDSTTPTIIGLVADITVTDDDLTVAASHTLDLNGNSLTLEGHNIHINTGSDFTIQDSAQDESNILTITESRPGYAGIFIDLGAKLTLDNARVDVTGGSNSAGIHVGHYETLEIRNNAVVTAQGGFQGAGLGSGYKLYSGTINISDSTVTATGGGRAAGIGSGSLGYSLEVSIENSIVFARGNQGGAGIGGGYGGNAASVTIKSSQVTVRSDESNAIGSGHGGEFGGSLSIDETSVVTLRGHEAFGGAASTTNVINAGTLYLHVSRIHLSGTGTPNIHNLAEGKILKNTSSPAGNLMIIGKTVSSQNPHIHNAGVIGFTPDFFGDLVEISGNNYQVTYELLDSTTVTQRVYGPKLEFASSYRTPPNLTTGIGWTTGLGAYDPTTLLTADITLYEFVANISVNNGADLRVWANAPCVDGMLLTLSSNISLSTQLRFACETTLDLNGHDLTVDGSNILVDGWTELTVADSSGDDSGTITVKNVPLNRAGIQVSTFAELVITGGTINATGGSQAAGIGSVIDENHGTITIHGGKIYATGGAGAAGIGQGRANLSFLNGGNITITDGFVEATGGSSGAGIGGGYEGSGGTITISGGDINAKGGNHAAGIGGGYNGNGGTIKIHGGIITGTGGLNGAGIGGGIFRNGGTIHIGSSTVTSTGGHEAAGIGGGRFGSGGTVSIVNSQVLAESDGNTIGAGTYGDSGGSLNIDETSTVTLVGDSALAGVISSMSLSNAGTLYLDVANIKIIGSGSDVIHNKSTGRILKSIADESGTITVEGLIDLDDPEILNEGVIGFTPVFSGDPINIRGNNFLVHYVLLDGTNTDERVYGPNLTFADSYRPVPAFTVGTGWVKSDGVSHDLATTLTGDITLYEYASIISISTETDLQHLANTRCLDGIVLSLATDLSLSSQLLVDCDITLDLNGHDITIDGANIAINVGEKLTISDSSAGETGTLSVLNAPSNIAGIETTDAELVITGGTIHIDGASYGIGGGTAVTSYVQEGGVVTVEAGIAPFGNSTAMGSVLIKAGTLRLPSGEQALTTGTGHRFEISAGAELLGTVADPTQGVVFTGVGSIANNGIITLAADNVLPFTSPELKVTPQHYVLHIDDGTANTVIRVFASTLDEGYRELPADPIKTHHVFNGWELPDGTFLTVTTDLASLTSYPGLVFTTDSRGGTVIAVTANWTDNTPTPTPTPTPSPSPTPTPDPTPTPTPPAQSSGGNVIPTPTPEVNEEIPEPTEEPTVPPSTPTPSPTTPAEQPNASDETSEEGIPAIYFWVGGGTLIVLGLGGWALYGIRTSRIG